MSGLENGAPAGDNDDGSVTALDRWGFPAAVFVGTLLSLYAFIFHGLAIFDFVTSRLPLLLPLAVTVLSIFTRATEITNYEAVLRTSNDLAIGIISFDIWMFSASHSDIAGRVLVNPDRMIRGDFVLAFLVVGLFTSVGCLVLTHYKFKTTRNRHRALLVGFLTSVLVYVMPFGVLQAVPPLKTAEPATLVQLHRYTVAIPYQDPEVIRFAPSVLRDRLFVRYERDISAPDPESAKTLATQRFLSGPESDAVRGRSRAASANLKVSIVQKDILAAVGHQERAAE